MKKILLGFVFLAALGAAYGIGYNKGALAHHGERIVVFPEKEKAAIIQTLQEQDGAWNRGDIDAFMQDYWKSDDLRFASGGTVKYGWQTTSDRYKARYPDKAAMGTLAFTDLDIEILSDRDALVFGRWKLTRERDAPGGLFTLHMRKENERWQIVSDHTSSAD